jgi:hypothetical protein
MCDDKRPTLTLSQPRGGENQQPISKIVIGMHDYYTGLDLESFSVKADFELAGLAAGEECAGRFKRTHPGVWEWSLPKPLTGVEKGSLVVSISDRQGNRTTIERTLSVATK